MQYENINEAWEKYKEQIQNSQYMQRLILKQRERDFREGYMKAYEFLNKTI